MNAQGTKKERLDRLMVLRGLAESREQAQRLIMAGEVEVDGKRQDKPGRAVPLDAAITVRRPLPYVSRGGFKLAAALDAFTVPVAGCVAIDVGASTGGFTDCLLQRGAARVYAVDVGYGQLAWKLRTDPRVIVMDRTNVRHLEALPDGALADLAVIDASFISLTLVLPAVLRLLKPNAQIIALVKPQFEAGVDDVGKGGVVRNIEVHRRVLHQISATAQSLGLHPAGLIASPVLGPAGNVEFLLWLKREPSGSDAFALEQAIANALEEAQQMQKRGQREAP
ncbi:TlyA family RNA methyltransferase [Caldilinea sp.]|uniref:TlyA family RNA methyltransferase n=1 Tax=Caldilinea sp. TaxID=2293560 RepID=UPI002628D832|nr:TlyA family RNA methyltransferase [uncultured Caldilinea sp.]